MRARGSSCLESHNKLPGWGNSRGCIGGERKAILKHCLQSPSADGGSESAVVGLSAEQQKTSYSMQERVECFSALTTKWL